MKSVDSLRLSDSGEIRFNNKLFMSKKDILGDCNLNRSFDSSAELYASFDN